MTIPSPLTTFGVLVEKASFSACSVPGLILRVIYCVHKVIDLWNFALGSSSETFHNSAGHRRFECRVKLRTWTTYLLSTRLQGRWCGRESCFLSCASPRVRVMVHHTNSSVLVVRSEVQPMVP
ncbi:hypothetical protein VTI74DRAFT_3291 [Chaetomium olivicolor]